MKFSSICFGAGLLVLGPSLVLAQNSKTPTRIQIGGTWKAETPDGPRSVIIRADSSASYGDETVRWRVQGDSMHIAFGDEWMVYHLQLKGTKLTLSGGDLEDPITLKRTGPATPLPNGVSVPPAPPDTQRAGATPVGPRSKKPKAAGTPARTTG